MPLPGIPKVNNGTKASQGDVQKMTVKQIKDTNAVNLFNNPKSKPITDGVMVNCYMLDPNTLEKNAELTGDYNVPRAVVTFNKRIEPLLVVFKQEVRDSLIVTDPVDRGIFTTVQCELINGHPFEQGDQDTLEEVLTLSEGEVEFWSNVNIDPYYMYLENTIGLVNTEYVEKNRSIMQGHEKPIDKSKDWSDDDFVDDILAAQFMN